MNVHWLNFFMFHLNALCRFFAFSTVIVARSPGARAPYHYHDKYHSTHEIFYYIVVSRGFITTFSPCRLHHPPLATPSGTRASVATIKCRVECKTQPFEHTRSCLFSLLTCIRLEHEKSRIGLNFSAIIVTDHGKRRPHARIAPRRSTKVLSELTTAVFTRKLSSLVWWWLTDFNIFFVNTCSYNNKFLIRVIPRLVLCQTRFYGRGVLRH